MRVDRVLVVLSGLFVCAGPISAQAQAQAQAQARQAQAQQVKPQARRAQAPSQPIQVYDARFENGDLRISGSVRKAGTTVILDEDISVIADSRGRFVFRLPHMPNNCVATLKSGEDEREVVVGNCGPAGQPGPKGEAGAKGEPGAKGEAGAKGEDGATGPQGVAGLQGSPGPQGVPGAKGETGPKGEAGPKGDTGPKGEIGPKGDTGPKGEAGARGAAGPQGPAGVAAPVAASSPLRAVRQESCPASGCAVTCETGETLVSAYCLPTGIPTMSKGTGAACPSESQGLVAVCGRL